MIFSIFMKQQFSKAINHFELLMKQKMIKKELNILSYYLNVFKSIKFLKMMTKYSNHGYYLVFCLNKFCCDRKVKGIAEKKRFKRSNIFFHLLMIF